MLIWQKFMRRSRNNGLYIYRHSAFLAILDEKDPNHHAAQKIWIELLQGDTKLLCTSYVLLESHALIQRRLGMKQVKQFQELAPPLLEIIWVGQSLHDAGIELLLQENRRRLSLVDCVSFEACRQHGIESVFAFDQHFSEQGFSIL